MNPTYIMVSLDLEQGVTSENRQKFNQALQHLGWSKHPGVTTTWSTCKNLVASHDFLFRQACADLGKASAVASNARLHAVLMVGNNKPVLVNNTK